MIYRPSALLITQAFPPLTAVGIHRMLGLSRYLMERGWQVTVLTAEPSEDESVDPELLRSIPEAVHVIRTPAPDLPLWAAKLLKGRKVSQRPADEKSPSPTPNPSTDTEEKPKKKSLKRWLVDWLSWWLHVPDGKTGWFLPGWWEGLKWAMRHRPDVIVSTGPRWTAQLIGVFLARFLRTPLITDFRDPWCGSAFNHVPYAAHRYVNRVLERMVVRRSNRITCAWDGIRRHLVRRYPRRAGNIVTILNGFDPKKFQDVSPCPFEGDRCVFLHAGGFYGPRSPLPLLEALRQCGKHHPHEFEKIQVVFLGLTSYGGRPLEQIIRDYQVQDSVRIIPRVPHYEALSYIKGADVALLFGQSGKKELASVPAKAYEYLALGKSVLAVDAGNEVCAIMRRGGCRVWRGLGSDPADMAELLAEIVRTHKQDTPDPDQQAEARKQFTHEQMARRFEELMKKVL